MNAPAITRRESLTGLALPLAAVFVLAVGYGVLPFVLARALGSPCSSKRRSARPPACSVSARWPRSVSRTS